MMTIGERIRKRRDELSINSVELADRVRVSQSYISQIENNRKIPPSDVLSRIAHALEISMEELDPDHNSPAVNEDIIVRRNRPSLKREDGSISIDVKNFTCAISVNVRPNKNEPAPSEARDVMFGLHKGLELAIERAIFEIIDSNKMDLYDIVTENLQSFAERRKKELKYLDEMIDELQEIKIRSDED